MNRKLNHPFYLELLKAMLLKKSTGEWFPEMTISQYDVLKIADKIPTSDDQLGRILRGSYKHKVKKATLDQLIDYLSPDFIYDNYIDFKKKEYWNGVENLGDQLFKELDHSSQKLILDKVEEVLIKEQPKTHLSFPTRPQYLYSKEEELLRSELDNLLTLKSENIVLRKINRKYSQILNTLVRYLDMSKGIIIKSLSETEDEENWSIINDLKSTDHTIDENLYFRLKKYNSTRFKGRIDLIPNISYEAEHNFIQLLSAFVDEQLDQVDFYLDKILSTSPFQYHLSDQLHIIEICIHRNKLPEAKALLKKASRRRPNQKLTALLKLEIAILKCKVLCIEDAYEESFEVLEEKLDFLKWITTNDYGSILLKQYLQLLKKCIFELQLSEDALFDLKERLSKQLDYLSPNMVA